MNVDLFLAYVAIGSISEILTAKQTSVGGKWGKVIYLITLGLILGLLVPESWNLPTMTGILFAFFGQVLGEVLRVIIDKIRMVRWEQFVKMEGVLKTTPRK